MKTRIEDLIAREFQEFNPHDDNPRAAEAVPARKRRTDTKISLNSKMRPATAKRRFHLTAALASINPIDILKRLWDILHDEFPQWPDGKLTEVAAALLRNPKYPVAHAMASADIYITWKALHSGSLSRGIMFDCFHLVNASYCDGYITKDRPQAEYAPIVLRSTEVQLYDGGSPNF